MSHHICFNRRSFLGLIPLCLLNSSLLAETQQVGKTYFILIGVENFASKEINPVTFANNDVRGMADTLQAKLKCRQVDHFDKQRPSGQMIVMSTDKPEPGQPRKTIEPTATNIVKIFSSLNGVLEPDDTLVVYWAGHAIAQDENQEEVILYTADTDLTSPLSLTKSSIKLGEMKASLAKPIKNAIFFVDACRTVPHATRGAGDGTPSADAIRGGTGTLAKSFVGSGNYAVLFACDKGQSAYPDSMLQHGAYTFYLIDALNKDMFSIQEIARHVRTKVGQWSEERVRKGFLGAGYQYPSVLLVGAPDIVLSPSNSLPPLSPSSRSNASTPSPIKVVNERLKKVLSSSELVEVPAGEFIMGEAGSSNNPKHKVSLSTYYIAKNLVTVEQYRIFCTKTDRKMPADQSVDRSKGNYPIVNISWEDANAFCNWLSGETNLKVRLPTEAQWEKAARGGDGRRYPWGNKWDEKRCANKSGSAQPAVSAQPVGHYSNGESPYHLFDMVGNVWQYCADYYDEHFWTGSRAKEIDPECQQQGTSNARIMRGGSWYSEDKLELTCSYRNWTDPLDIGEHANHGFRFVVIPK